MIPALNDLRVVELARLMLHEAHDEARLARVRDEVRDEAVQRNPIIVAPLPEDHRGVRHFVLDGAHRVRALAELDCTFALVQLVGLPESAGSWAHLLPWAGLEEALRSVQGVEVLAEKPDSACLVEARFHGGRRLYVRAENGGLVQEVRALRALQDVYPRGAVVRRVEPGAAVEPARGEALLLYRRFAPAEFATVVERGEVLPAGITRFVVEERVLNVRYPLRLLAGGDPERRNAELREFVERSCKKGRIRRYAEPVVLFE